MPLLVHTQPITDPSPVVKITLKVPNGPDRQFFIQLKDRNGFVLYSGVLVIDVGSGGAPQEVTIDVNIDEELNAGDYVTIGRQHLEKWELELAYVAFDTAININSSHPVASFFRGFTHLLLLIQKDDPNVDAAQPNEDLANVLSLYVGLDDIYTDTIFPAEPEDPNELPRDPYTMPPDIYDTTHEDNYEDKVTDFLDYDWKGPAITTTDSSVDVLENVILREIDNIIEDLSKAALDPAFSTTITSDMHFDLQPTINVDRADAYILQTIAYGLKAYLNYILAYQLRTDPNYWEDNLDPDNPIYDPTPGNPLYIGQPYEGVQDVIKRADDEGDELFDFVGDPTAYFTRSRNAFSYGLAKLKAGLQSMGGRNDADKIDENHIFNVVDIEDPILDVEPPDEPPDVATIDISKVTKNIDEARLALEQQTRITIYDNYDENESEPAFETVDVDASVAFDSSLALNRDRLPTLYYHQDSEEDVPIFDTNNPASSDPVKDFMTGLVKDIDGTAIRDLEDLLAEEMLPSPYYFSVPVVATNDMKVDGKLDDFDGLGIQPVMFDEADDDEGLAGSLDMRRVYLAHDNDNLYLAVEVGSSAPYTGPFGEGDWLNYSFRFNARDSSCDWDTAPISLELSHSGSGWEWRLYSYGYDTGVTPEFAYDMNKAVEVSIPFSDVRTWLKGVPEDETWEWDGEAVFMAVSLWSRLSSVEAGDWVSECLLGTDLTID
jgi:hypothetical protein